jgi:hypothetical protein
MLIDIVTLFKRPSKFVKISLNTQFIDKYRELIALSHISQNVSSIPGGNITDFSKRHPSTRPLGLRSNPPSKTESKPGRSGFVSERTRHGETRTLARYEGVICYLLPPRRLRRHPSTEGNWTNGYGVGAGHTTEQTGESLPCAAMLPRIAALYGCTVDELLREDSAPAAHNKAAPEGGGEEAIIRNATTCV